MKKVVLLINLFLIIFLSSCGDGSTFEEDISSNLYSDLYGLKNKYVEINPFLAHLYL